MASGLTMLFGRLFRPGRRVAARTAALRAAGATVDLERLPIGARTIEIDLGYGAEAWLAPSGPVEVTAQRAVAGGALVLTDDSPARPRLLRSRGLALERIPTRQ